MVFLALLLLPVSGSHGHDIGATTNISKCWSAWSPCTVTCISQSREAREANFARRWRVWLTRRCPDVTPPNQHTEFKPCSESVPHCLELENIFQPSPRTIYRLTALVLLMLMAVVPSVLICCKYSTGFPMIRWERSHQESPRSSMLDAILISEQLESIRSHHGQQRDCSTSPSEKK